MVKTAVVWKLDRISRRQRDGINVLADWCERDVRVVSVTQQIDLSGAVGRMVASVMFGLAEIELGVSQGTPGGWYPGGSQERCLCWSFEGDHKRQAYARKDAQGAGPYNSGNCQCDGGKQTHDF